MLVEMIVFPDSLCCVEYPQARRAGASDRRCTSRTSTEALVCDSLWKQVAAQLDWQKLG